MRSLDQKLSGLLNNQLINRTDNVGTTMQSDIDIPQPNVKTKQPSLEPRSVICPKTQTAESRYVILDGVKLNCSLRYVLVILVSTHVKNRKRRDTIRQMWANYTKWRVPDHLPWTVVFNVGFEERKPSLENITHDLQDEIRTHGDLIVGNVTESFYTLSRKLSISIDWVNRNLAYDFFLKTDDDVFINVPKIIHNLLQIPNHIEYLGHVMWRQPVERKGRYALTPKEFKSDRYDPYCSGGGFISRQGIISKIARYLVFENPLKYEDAYFGSLVYRIGKVPSWNYKTNFVMFNKECKFYKDLWVSHPAKTSKCMMGLMEQALSEKFEF
ncbi:lactosylceramide 1,3-N-acetyl-beta-D-glucosaminyltransferase A-like [Clytia hemisphaerica]|uniref:lactosylceramide 1,3-N-acetyl-beta-D-glucosaminyltransferase A-like n=1 Tax=Clytia hemisphaerica TaxID=252671 RepID=UPI0034D56C11